MTKIQVGHAQPVALCNTTDDYIGVAGSPLEVSGTVTEAAPTSATASTNQITVSATAVLIIPANTARLGGSIINTVGPNTVYWGQTAGVTTLNGFPVPAGSAFNWDFPNYTGDVYVISTGSGQLLGKVELT